MSAGTQTAQTKKRYSTPYMINMAITLLLMFGFGLLPPFATLTPVGMRVLGIFIGVIYGFSTCEIIWLSLFAFLAFGLSGYTNIALFGLDTRTPGQLGKGNRSDTIIIASINNDTQEVRLVSVYRDTYLDLANGKFNKCNGAYSSGGPEQAMAMLNKNLDLDIQYYISVDFAALTETIDLLGGIYIDVDETEISHLNNYTVETSVVTGVETQKLTQTGLQLLDGVQATSYCRIRYTDGDDFKRTERQREVIGEIVNTAKKADITEINEIINAVFSKIATNYTNEEIIQMAPEMIGYNIVDTQGFPFDRVPASVKGKGSCVVPVNLAENVKQLHEYLFGNYSYTPSEEVQAISNQITSDTGY